MSLLGNPVPTSGEIRALRRRLGKHIASLTSVATVDEVDAAASVGAATDPDGLARRIANPRQGMKQLLAEPRVRRVLDAVAAAGAAGLDTLEQVSDDTHDTVEESLARLIGWPRAMYEIARTPATRTH